MTGMLYAGSVEDLQQTGVKVVTGNKETIAVFHHQGKVYAVDNRCPHMGFPLHMGSLCDGILTCHWHHARFSVETGGTLDPWADDVATYPVEVKEGEIWVDPTPSMEKTKEKHRQRLLEGLEQNLSLVIAKAVVALVEAGEPPEEIARIGILYGTKYRREGWRSGLTILTSMVNILPKLDEKGRILALFQGLRSIARESAGSGTRFLLNPLPDSELEMEQLAGWYRSFIEVRDIQGAERVLLTAIQKDATPEELTDMMMAAVTDHFYMDGGHTLDFHNKAFEILEHIGPGYRDYVLTSQLPQMRNASRSEENHSWQTPVNLILPLQEAFRELETLHLPQQKESDIDEKALVKQILSDQPEQTVTEMLNALKEGVAPVRLAQLVALAAATRVARFNLQNEFSDWITALHTFTHSHAVHQSLRRSVSNPLIRGIFHGAMTVYLDRFLNIPPARLPKIGSGITVAPPATDELLILLDQQQQVAEAANWVASYLERGGDEQALFNVLGHALLREDAEFHAFQMYEAAMVEIDHWNSEKTALAEEAKQTLLFAVTRYLAAHAPTSREIPHTVEIALRLHRGERLFEEE